MIAALSNIWDLSDWIGAKILAYDGEFGQSAQAHVEIVRRMSRGEYEQAAEMMGRHLHDTEMRFLEQMKQTSAGED